MLPEVGSDPARTDVGALDPDRHGDRTEPPRRWVLDLGKQPDRLGVRIGRQLGDGGGRTPDETGLVEQHTPLGQHPGGEHRIHQVGDLRHVLDPTGDRLESRVRRPLRSADHLAEPRPPVRLRHEQQDPPLVGGEEALLQGMQALAAPRRTRILPVDEGRGQVGRHRPGGGREQVDVDHLTLAGAVDQAERGEDSGEQGQRRAVVALRRSGPRRLRARHGDRMGDPTAAEEGGDVVAGAGGVRAVESVTGQRGVHQPRVSAVQGPGVQAELPLPLGQQVVDEDIGPGCEGLDQRAALRPVQRYGDPPLTPVVQLEAGVDRRAALGHCGLAGDAAQGVAPQRFDLHHVGAEVGQHRRRPRGSHPVGHLDDADPVQGCDHDVLLRTTGRSTAVAASRRRHVGPPWRPRSA